MLPLYAAVWTPSICFGDVPLRKQKSAMNCFSLLFSLNFFCGTADLSTKTTVVIMLMVRAQRGLLLLLLLLLMFFIYTIVRV
jgi:hypothetical protein